jgi:rRNA-processing protein FCF1
LENANKAQRAKLRLQSINEQTMLSRNEQIQAELRKHVNKQAQLELQLKRLETETKRTRREAKEAAEAEQLRQAAAMEKEKALTDQLKQHELQLNEHMRKARAEHKVLGGMCDSNFNSETMILVADSNWLIAMKRKKVEEFLVKLDEIRNLFLFIPCVVIEELDRIKNKPCISNVVKQLIAMMTESQSRSLIIHTTLQLTTDSLQRLHALHGQSDNQILEVYDEVVKCTARTPILLTGDGSFQMKVARNRCYYLFSTSIHDILCSACNYDK